MANWTDPSRQYLINLIKTTPVIWNKNYLADNNYRSLKSNAFRQVTDDMNTMFPMATKFSCEDVRSQWKNLKDTFVRKLRWVHEGKYMEDAIKEPTWKFYRMLTFLDDKEAKRLGNLVEHTFELAPSRLEPDRKSMLPSTTTLIPITYKSTSTEQQMLQMFSSPPVLQQEPGLIDEQLPVCSSNDCCPQSPNGSSSGVEEDEEEPNRKRSYRKSQAMPPGTPSKTDGQDEFDHFGALVASHLRRLCGEQGRASATRVQKKLSDVLFSE